MRYDDADRMSDFIIRADKPPENEWFVSRLVREAFSPRKEPSPPEYKPFPVPEFDRMQFQADADEIRRNMEKNKLPVDASGRLIFPSNSLNVGQDWLEERLNLAASGTPDPAMEIPPLDGNFPPLGKRPYEYNPDENGYSCGPSKNEVGPTEPKEDVARTVESTANPNIVRPIDQSTTHEPSIRPAERAAEPKFLDMSSPY